MYGKEVVAAHGQVGCSQRIENSPNKKIQN